MPVTLLAIESSCDDTSAAVICNGEVLSNVVASQLEHDRWGGVVPELAARAHLAQVEAVVKLALTKANKPLSSISAVAFTQGPGLLGSLLIGSSFAKSLALGMEVPLIAVNHMEAHILAHFIDEPKPEFPFLCLTVSGGHTQLVVVNSATEMQVLGETLDDAVGEAFDKIGKMMGLGFPAGHKIDKLAITGNPHAFSFPVYEVGDFNFSFSGIKTAFLYFVRDKDPQWIQANLPDLSASIQHTLINLLMKKVVKAMDKTGLTQIAIAGGVSANSGLRDRMQKEASTRGWKVFVPDFQYCTDNAGMVAMAAWFKWQQQQFAPLDTVPNPRLKIGDSYQ